MRKAERPPSRDMLSCFGSTVPEAAPSGVDVAVLNGIDVGPKDITMTMCMIVHAVLDVDKLKTGLFAAIEHKLPRAGARLALRNGLYEFHIPQSFSDVLPPCAFTHLHHHKSFVGTGESIPPSIPSGATSEPYLFDAPMSSTALCRGPNTPREMKDFLVPGTPLLHVHIASFDDATLIGTTTSHAMFDAQGFRVLFDAWTAALRGDFESFASSPRIYAPYDHIAKDVRTQTQSQIQLPLDQPKRGFFALGFFGTVRFVAKFLLRVVRDPRERTKLLYVPHEWLAKRKEECMVQLSATEGKEYVGSSDVLVAYVCKILHSTRTDATPIHLHIPVNLRPLLPEYFPHPYLHNAVSDCVLDPTPTAVQFASQPLVTTALAIRRAINAYKSDRAFLLAELAWEQREGKGTGVPLLPARPGGEWVIATNWRSSNLNDVDFSGARVEGEMRSAKAQFVIGCVQDGIKVPLRGGVVVHSESKEGIWLAIVQSEKVWERVKRSSEVKFA